MPCSWAMARPSGQLSGSGMALAGFDTSGVSIAAAGWGLQSARNSATPLLAGARKAMEGCDQAGSQGLECLFQKGSWAQLRTLNRPAVLTLTDDVGRTHQVVLTGLTDESATIQLGGAAREVPITALSRYWFGDFLLLWKPPMALAKSLVPGMRGADVRWLRDSMRVAQGLPQAPALQRMSSTTA